MGPDLEALDEQLRAAERLEVGQRKAIATDQAARSPALLQTDKTATEWRLRQVVVDPEGDLDWAILAVVDLAASDDVGAAVLTVTSFERLGG